MTDTTIPDRDNRPGGRWSTPGLLDELLRLATCERAQAHLIAGWAVKIPELDDEQEVVAGLEGALARAVALRNHALALLERDESGLTATRRGSRPCVSSTAPRARQRSSTRSG